VGKVGSTVLCCDSLLRESVVYALTEKQDFERKVAETRSEAPNGPDSPVSDLYRSVSSSLADTHLGAEGADENYSSASCEPAQPPPRTADSCAFRSIGH
jgi:hypothetical protein